MYINLYNTDCQVITTEEGEKLKKAFNQMHREKEGFYQFRVSDVKDIDLNRIVREQYEAGHLVTLITDREKPRILICHNEFLQKFQEKDGLLLVGDYLRPQWGWAVVIRIDGGWWCGGIGEVELKNARVLCLNLDVEAIKKELAAARAFVRKITVKVHTL